MRLFWKKKKKNIKIHSVSLNSEFLDIWINLISQEEMPVVELQHFPD